MKKTLLLIVLGATNQFFAQNDWIKLGPPPPAIQIIDEFDNVTASDHAFADIDNDGDQDVLLAGATFSNGFICKLYVNDGNGGFAHDTSAPFVGVYNGSVAFADLDNDGDQDAVVAGNDNVNYSARLYMNDGTGAFTLASSPFEGVGYSTIAIEDADGDSDLDVFIGGQSMYGVISNLYMNDGNAGFTLNTVASSTFPGIYMGTAEFGDIDGDGDADFILMGYGNSGIHSELFFNDGNAVFTLSTATFPTLNGADIAFSDTDADSDLDMIISGDDPNTGPLTILYANDGTGSFTATGNSFLQTGAASLDFGDIDGDGDDDLLLAGNTWTIGTATQLYTNDGSGVFTQVTGTTIASISNGSSKFADIDGDSNIDILVTGNYQASLFMNDGTGAFSALPTTPFSGSQSGAIEFADVDSDGDADVLITGQGSSTFSTQLYLNDGTGGYAYDNTNAFPNVANSAADFGDIDGDGDQDLMISGYGTGQVTQLFTNDGTGVFTLVPSPFPNVSSGSVEFHDVDNDGDQDVVMTGFIIFSGNVGQLWMNDGTGNFTLSANNFEGASSTTISFADIDSDNDDDLLITGYGNVGRIAKLYTNDGTGMFTLIASPFPGVQQGATDFADVDGDGDQDLVIAGEIGSSTYTSELYTNDGTGQFTLVAGTPFDPTITSGMIFSDIDNDLDPDLMTIGSNNSYQCIAKMYANDGTGTFTLISGTPFEASSQGMMAFGDIDGDEDDDLVIAGNTCATGIETNLYRNDNCQQSNGIDVHQSCDSYTWIDGVEYTESNHTASMTYSNAAGCDSVVVLHLTIGDYDGIPDMAVLPNVTAECEVASITPPTATMNCTGMVTGTTTQTFPISVQDTTEIVWTYTAPNGFEMTQTQLVIIHNVTPPVPDMAVLPNVTAECEVASITPPTATMNCTGMVTGTTTQTFPISTQDTTEVVWTYVDINGLETTQTQLVIIHDTTAPVPNMASLPTAMSPCPFTTLGLIPTATDNCGGTITGTTTDLPVSTPGTTTITWTFTDANGNTSTQTEDLIYTPLNNEVTFDGTTLTATQSFNAYQWYDCNAEENIPGATSQSYTPTANGSYSVTVHNNECSVTSDCFEVTGLAINELTLSIISIYPNPNAGSFTIETSNAVTITISNAAGQLVHTEELQSGKTAIDLKNLENGVYFLNSIHPDGSGSTQKVSILK